MAKKQPIPNWIYVILAILALVPIVTVVVIGKYMVPKMYSAAKATAALGKDDTLQYRGQTIQLSKAYADFDEYKNDPNNIAASETARVQQLVMTAPIADRYPTREALVAAVMEIEFPGYGMTAFGEVPQADGSTLTGFAIEIPRLDRERIIVFQPKNGAYKLLDDFLGPPDIMEVRVQNGQLRYLDARQQLVLSRPILQK
ncbi:MAG TPA: hypothetical protein VGP94_07285 [Tepidisphaeraceae bacterium]|nr:hypothetical protein [Tepidisphaeraceae bacterium]